MGSVVGVGVEHLSGCMMRGGVGVSCVSGDIRVSVTCVSLPDS